MFLSYKYFLNYFIDDFLLFTVFVLSFWHSYYSDVEHFRLKFYKLFSSSTFHFSYLRNLPSLSSNPSIEFFISATMILISKSLFCSLNILSFLIASCSCFTDAILPVSFFLSYSCFLPITFFCLPTTLFGIQSFTLESFSYSQISVNYI